MTTEKLFQKHLQGAAIGGKEIKDAKPDFPYWGDRASTFAWNMASLPSSDIEALGPGVDVDFRPILAQMRESLDNPASAEDEPLFKLAQKSLPLSVGVLSQCLMEMATNDQAEESANFIVRAQDYAQANPHPPWLNQLQTDAQFVSRLIQETSTHKPETESLGLFDSIANLIRAADAKLTEAVGKGIGWLGDKAGDFASTKMVGWLRPSLNAQMGTFFGDVFLYLDTRGDKSAPGDVPKFLSDEIDKAVQKTPDEPLVLAGHSLGAVILFDMLSHFRTDLKPDLFLSVGTQISHFEELKRFKSSNRAIPSAQNKKAPTPPNIRNWINALDRVDIFSYACENVFDRVSDFEYDTATHTVAAHSQYLLQDRFFRRLRARVDQLP